MQIVRARDQRAMPWKNGGGVTYEIAIFPPQCRSLDDFDWRVSMARVEADGPFSPFPGIDRSLAIVDGAGVRLTIDGGEAILTMEAPPLAFAGDLPVTSALLNGPVTDFNVMTRRGAWSHRLARETIAGHRLVEGDSDTTLWIVRTGAIAIDGRADTAPLTARDTLILARGEQVSLAVGEIPAEVFRVDLVRATSATRF